MLRAFCTGHTLQVRTQCASDARDTRARSATATRGMQAGSQRNDLVSRFFSFFLLKVLCTGSAPQCQPRMHAATCRQHDGCMRTPCNGDATRARACTPWRCNARTHGDRDAVLAPTRPRLCPRTSVPAHDPRPVLTPVRVPTIAQRDSNATAPRRAPALAHARSSPPMRPVLPHAPAPMQCDERRAHRDGATMCPRPAPAHTARRAPVRGATTDSNGARRLRIRSTIATR